MSVNREIQCEIGPNETFSRLCQYLSANDIGKVDLGYTAATRLQDLRQLADAVAAGNNIVWRVLIYFTSELNENQSFILGNFVRCLRDLQSLVITPIDRAGMTCNFDPFWDQVATGSRKIDSIELSGNEAVSSFAKYCGGKVEVKELYVLDVSSSVGFDGIVSLMQLPTLNVSELGLSFKKTFSIADEDIYRFATAMGVGSSLKCLSFGYPLNDECARAFGREIPKNKTLTKLYLRFNNSTVAMSELTKGVVANETLKNVIIFPSLPSPPFYSPNYHQPLYPWEKEWWRCEDIVKHAITLNRLGRKYLHGQYEPPNNASVEDYWVSTLIDNINNPEMDDSVRYSWIRDNVDIFVRQVGLPGGIMNCKSRTRDITVLTAERREDHQDCDDCFKVETKRPRL